MVKLLNSERIVILFRIIGHYFLAGLCLLLPEIGDNRFLLAGLLAFVVAPLALFCSLKYNLMSNGWTESYFDLITLIILVHLIPEQWTLVLMLGVVLALSPSFSIHSKSYIYYFGAAILLIIGMTIAAIVHNVPNWHLYITLLIAVYPGVMFYANWQMQRANDLRAQAQKVESMRLIAGGVAHDFNNILTAVMGNTEIAQLYMDPTHPSFESLTEVMLATTRAGLLSKQLLFFSGRQTNDFGSYNLQEELTAIISLVRSTVASDIKISLDIPPNLPNGYGDPTQIQQIFLNLLLNATEASKAPTEIHISASEEILDSITRLVATVEDKGTGIEQDLLNKIFDPFYSSKSQGHGLGLATVARIVKEHQGEIKVESQANVGTTIKVYLPIDKTTKQAETEPHSTPALNEGELLIVDDEAIVRQVLARFLEPAGYVIHEAGNGEEALKLFEQKCDRINLILLDLKMPIMDGWDCLKRIRKINPRVPVVIISGYNPDEATEGTQDAHLQYITKPFLRADVLRTIAKMQ